MVAAMGPVCLGPVVEDAPVIMQHSNESLVAVHSLPGSSYPTQAPFNPSSQYPEYAGGLSSEINNVYQGIRACFHLAGLDAEHYGTPQWNPLGSIMHPGETVLLKPNLIKGGHPRDPDGWQYVVTHGSVIRAVADYVWKAIGETGTIILADAPQTDSSFSDIVRLLGLDTLRDYYRQIGFNLELIDLRQEEWTNRDGVIVERRKLPPNPYGSVAFDLGDSSEFHAHPGSGRYYGADYDAGEVNRHHANGRHEYLLAGAAVKCDVIFSLPKLKTHKKAGITVSLKNLVGVNADKNWLPHHTEGDPRQGGDEHPSPDLMHRLERSFAAQLRRLAVAFPGAGSRVLRSARSLGTRVFGDTEEVIRSGNWSGNDTVWRMCLDLNKLVLYGNPDGTLRPPTPENRKRHYVLVDGIVAGEGRGPMNPDPVRSGLVIFGTNVASVDATCAYLIGFDPERIPIVRQAFCSRSFPLVVHGWRQVQVVSNVEQWNATLDEIPHDSTFHFRPHFGWQGCIERNPTITDNANARPGKPVS
jgi:uncharacterized protein (DUF362 family)